MKRLLKAERIKMNKLIVEYDPDKGQVFSDNESTKYVDNICKTFVNAHIVVGTKLLVNLFRCAIADKKIKHGEVEFLFKDEQYWPDNNHLVKERKENERNKNR